MKLRIHFHEQSVMTPLREIAGEAIGSFLLVVAIFALAEGCNLGRPNDALAPVFIGLTVTVIICLIAPLTQAGLNLARDLRPRLVAWLSGWGAAAFPDRIGGFFQVYILAPLLGGSLAALLFVRVLEPLMGPACGTCDCTTPDNLPTGEKSP